MEQKTVTIACQDDSARWAGNTHRIIIKEETAENFIGWPDPTDKRNSSNWNPATDKPMTYPKFAWKIIPA